MIGVTAAVSFLVGQTKWPQTVANNLNNLARLRQLHKMCVQHACSISYNHQVLVRWPATTPQV
eukprot:scaffold111064_cov15-Tisochrysis_lutea.AAC.1